MRLRLILIVLVILNLALAAYQLFTPDPRASAAARIEELQINPGRMKLRDSASRGTGHSAAGKSGKSAYYRACLEWGPFTGADVSRADSALARLTLPQPPLQRPMSDVAGVKRFAYFVREPDAAAVAQIAELARTFPGTEIKAGPCPG